MTDEQMEFGWTEKEADAPDAAAALPMAARLKDRLGKLAGKGIHVGTSSWKYPGWLGQVYDRSRYEHRGKFAQTRFNRDCLAEYATVFPTVCGDFAFYQFPSQRMWEGIFEKLPPGHRFSLKVCEEVTVEKYPKHRRYGARAGMENPDFMNAELVQEKLLSRLEPYRDRLGALIFEFGTIHDEDMRRPDRFAAELDKMLEQLPGDGYKFAVEVRNAAFLDPPSPYLACLREHGVAHCFNSWTRMPSVGEQMRLPDTFTAPHVAARFLLRPGRTYQQAVDMFSPYEHIQDPYPEGREELHELIERCLAEQRMLFAFVNNRFEGNAIETIDLAT